MHKNISYRPKIDLMPHTEEQTHSRVVLRSDDAQVPETATHARSMKGTPLGGGLQEGTEGSALSRSGLSRGLCLEKYIYGWRTRMICLEKTSVDRKKTGGGGWGWNRNNKKKRENISKRGKKDKKK